MKYHFRKLKEEPQLSDSKAKILTYSSKEALKLKGTFIVQIEAFGKETQKQNSMSQKVQEEHC